MTKHIKLTDEQKDENKIVREITSIVNNAKKGLMTYRESIQCAFEVFVGNYNTKLRYNHTPLLTILKGLNANDKKPFLDYLHKATNIKTCKVIKDKMTLVFDNVKDEKNPLQYDDKFIDDNKWYDKAKKEESKPLTLDDESLLKRFVGLLSLAKKSNMTSEQITTAFNKAMQA